MVKSRVIRVDADFLYMIERGRRQWQIATGKNITMPVYTAYMANMFRPLMEFDKQMKKHIR